MLAPVVPVPRSLAALALCAACSVLPEARYPAFAEHLVAADFVVPEGGRLRLPVTTDDLVVHDLGAVPPPERELFDADGGRWLLYAPGTHVQVRCRYRSYAANGGRPLSPGEVLPGARRIELLPAP